MAVANGGKGTGGRTFQIAQESPLERVSASLDDLQTVEALLTNLWEQLSVCWELD